MPRITLIGKYLPILRAIAIAACFHCGAAFAGDGELLSLERCIEIAVASRPNLAEAKSAIEAASARLGLAAASYRTTLGASSSYGYSRSDGLSSGQNGRAAADLSLSQTIFDWGRNDLSVQSARQSLSAVSQDALNTMSNVIANVSTSYYSLNRSSRALLIAADRADNYEKRLGWAKTFYDAGAKAKIEVTKAETDLANARLDLVQAKGALERSQAELAHAIGLSEWTGGVADSLAYTSYDVAVRDAVDRALFARPDITAQAERVKAAELAVELAKKGNSPTLTGRAGYSFSGETDPTDTRGWSVSVGIDIPVFDGGMTRERVRQSEAELSGSKAKLAGLMQDVVLNIRSAHSALTEARESVAAAREAERQAKETLELAQGRYRAGVGESLEISTAVDGYAQARIKSLTALYSLKAAEIKLKQEMGALAE
ncbi:outer membrane efflux protein [Synergistales bacterium]|nr:outer membrane efflux protein [Synergistales bacterium]